MLPLLFAMCASPAAAEGLDIVFFDDAPLDGIMVRNLGCPLFDAELTIDMTTSASQVVIDTEYGGVGTQDPGAVSISAGEAQLLPVADGAQQITLVFDMLPLGGEVIVTFDADDALSKDHWDRVRVDPGEFAGSIALLRVGGEVATATFDATATTQLIPPPAARTCLSS